jgi:E3 ubiquitin-protein ligase RNF31
VAINHCGDANPIEWLKENWTYMLDTVVTLATNAGHEAEENTVGTLSRSEAKEALRKHKGNIWAAMTDCVDGRRNKVRTGDNFSENQVNNSLLQRFSLTS